MGLRSFDPNKTTAAAMNLGEHWWLAQGVVLIYLYLVPPRQQIAHEMQHDKHELSSVDHFISTVKNRQHPTNRVVLWNNTWYHITQFEYKNNIFGSDEFQYKKLALALAAENLASVAVQLKIKLPTKNKWVNIYLHDKKKLLNFSHPSFKKVSSNSEFNYGQECSSWQAVNVFPIVVAYCFLTLTSCRQKKSYFQVTYYRDSSAESSFLLAVSLLFLLNSPLENFGIFV